MRKDRHAANVTSDCTSAAELRDSAVVWLESERLDGDGSLAAIRERLIFGGFGIRDNGRV